MDIISFRRGDRRSGEYPKYSQDLKKEGDSDSLIGQKSEELVKLKQLPLVVQNPEIDSQESDIDSLKIRIAELEKEVKQLKEELKIDFQAGEIEELKQKNNSQADEIKSLNAKIAELEKEVKQLKGDRNILLIGQVCRKFQANLYQYVFPGKRISPYYSYKMANLEQDIEKSKSESVKDKARDLWKELKDKEDPERFQNLVEELQNLRNTTAHPEMTDLNVEDVLKAVEEVDKQAGFEFLDRTDFNFEDVKDLIKMWGRIEGYIN